MASSFNVDQEIIIRGNRYKFCEHPFAMGMPFGQEGRAAVVYQLSSIQKYFALKVFKPRFSDPSLVTLADQLSIYADLKGLEVCSRIVLTPRADADLLRQFPDLTYAVLMPWIEGQTWQETVMKKEAFTPQQSLALAHSFANLLMAIEERGLAHCDLSGANVILENKDEKEPSITLVDVEGMFAPGLPQPNILSAGSPGYAHHAGNNLNLWSSHADRFAGAILLAEMLSWCDPMIRQISQMESFFIHQNYKRIVINSNP